MLLYPMLFDFWLTSFWSPFQSSLAKSIRYLFCARQKLLDQISTLSFKNHTNPNSSGLASAYFFLMKNRIIKTHKCHKRVFPAHSEKWSVPLTTEHYRIIIPGVSHCDRLTCPLSCHCAWRSQMHLQATKHIYTIGDVFTSTIKKKTNTYLQTKPDLRSPENKPYHNLWIFISANYETDDMVLLIKLTWVSR